MSRVAAPASTKSSDQEFVRVDGNSRSRLLYFLPWCVSTGLARALGMVGRDFLACYEIPRALVSPEPGVAVASLKPMIDDAQRLIGDRRDIIIVGLCLGNCPATFLAAAHDLELWSVATADRAELMIWQSPAARFVREHAERLGYTPQSYARHFYPYQPALNVTRLRAPPKLVVGRYDSIVPPRRSRALISAVQKRFGDVPVCELPLGHVGTLIAGSVLLRGRMSCG